MSLTAPPVIAPGYRKNIESPQENTAFAEKITVSIKDEWGSAKIEPDQDQW